MRWTPGRRSANLEDRRGETAGGGLGGGRLGLGGIVVLLVLSLVFGKDFFRLVGTEGGTPAVQGAPVQASAEEEREVEFVSFVLDDAQAVWARLLPRA